MRILVTGARGFIGRNLTSQLRCGGCGDIYEFDADNGASLLERYTRDCEFVYHLAGINRPENEQDFMDGNCGFTYRLLDLLKQHRNAAPVLFASSIQAAYDNPYGRSKRAAEELLFAYGRETGAAVSVYRLPNLFGKWSRPNYNSVVATYCHNISRGLGISVSNPDAYLTLCYIDDVCNEFIGALHGRESGDKVYCRIPVSYRIGLGALAETIRGFNASRELLSLPDLSDPLTKKLYSTYLSFLPEDEFSYDLGSKTDARGSFTEFLRTPDRGQISINISKPSVTKGNHWHRSKVEKFLAVSGSGLIRLRSIWSREIAEYRVSGESLRVVDIPPGYTHSIVNTGHDDLVALIWANECYDPKNPDTYRLEVDI